MIVVIVREGSPARFYGGRIGDAGQRWTDDPTMAAPFTPAAAETELEYMRRRDPRKAYGTEPAEESAR